MEEIIIYVLVFIFGVLLGIAFLSWWTLKSLKNHDLTLINGKDTWVERS